jgi:hypothetical protein
MPNNDSAGKSLTSLTDIARGWGLTNRELGDILTNAGYRCDGKPTDTALDDRLAVVTYVGDYPKHSWSRDVVGSFLEKGGRTKQRLWERTDKQFYLVVPIVL